MSRAVVGLALIASLLVDSACHREDRAGKSAAGAP